MQQNSEALSRENPIAKEIAVEELSHKIGMEPNAKVERAVSNLNRDITPIADGEKQPNNSSLGIDWQKTDSPITNTAQIEDPNFNVYGTRREILIETPIESLTDRVNEFILQAAEVLDFNSPQTHYEGETATTTYILPKPIMVAPELHMEKVKQLQARAEEILTILQSLYGDAKGNGIKASFPKIEGGNGILAIDSKIQRINYLINTTQDSDEIDTYRTKLNDLQQQRAGLLQDDSIHEQYQRYYDVLKLRGRVQVIYDVLKLAELTPEEQDIFRAITALTPASAEDPIRKLPSPEELLKLFIAKITRTADNTYEDFGWKEYGIFAGMDESKIENILLLFITLQDVNNPRRWTNLQRYDKVFEQMFKINHMLSKTRIWRNKILTSSGDLKDLVAALQERSNFATDGNMTEIFNAFLTFDDGDMVSGYDRFRRLVMMHETQGLIAAISSERVFPFNDSSSEYYYGRQYHTDDFVKEFNRQPQSDRELHLFAKAFNARDIDATLKLFSIKDIMFLIDNFNGLYPYKKNSDGDAVINLGPKEQVTEGDEKITRTTMALLAAKGSVKLSDPEYIRRAYVIESGRLKVTQVRGKILFRWDGVDVTPDSDIKLTNLKLEGNDIPDKNLYETLNEMLLAGGIVEKGVHDLGVATLIAAKDRLGYKYAYPPIKWLAVMEDLSTWVTRYDYNNYPTEHLFIETAKRFPFLISTTFEQSRVVHPRTGKVVSFNEVLAIWDLTKEEAAALRFDGFLNEEIIRPADTLARAMKMLEILQKGIFSTEKGLDKLHDATGSAIQQFSDLSAAHELQEHWKVVRKAILYKYQTWSTQMFGRVLELLHIRGIIPENDPGLVEFYEVMNGTREVDLSSWINREKERDWFSLITLEVYRTYEGRGELIRRTLRQEKIVGDNIDISHMTDEALNESLNTLFTRSAPTLKNTTLEPSKDIYFDIRRFVMYLLDPEFNKGEKDLHPHVTTQSNFSPQNPSAAYVLISDVSKFNIFDQQYRSDPLISAILEGLRLVVRGEHPVSKEEFEGTLQHTRSALGRNWSVN